MLLIILVTPQIIALAFGDETFNFGDSTSLTCSVHKGDLPINLSWLHENVSIGYMEGIMVSKVGQKNSMLTIDSITEQHAGKYTCISENKAGVARSSAQLNVNGIFSFLLFVVVFSMVILCFFSKSLITLMYSST